MENVDESDHPVPDGAMGAKTLVTVLANHTLPLIRYELSDRIVIEPSPCACGKPYARIREVRGRQGDVVRLPGRDGADVTIAPAQITACLRGSPVKQWQLQVAPDGLSIACVCAASEFQEADVLARPGALLTASGAQSLAIRATHIDRLERTPTGKENAGHDADALTHEAHPAADRPPLVARSAGITSRANSRSDAPASPSVMPPYFMMASTSTSEPRISRCCWIFATTCAGVP